MSTNILFFRLYLLAILIFLLIFCFFLSKQLLILLNTNLSLLFIVRDLKKRYSSIRYTYENLFSFYLLRENLFLSIVLSEFVIDLNKNLIQKDVLYGCLAYCYYQKSFYTIAEYYYLKILYVSPLDEKATSTLGAMYYNLGYKKKAYSILNVIS
uniref:Ycf37 n=1 Tax=Dipterosiphonia australica TaxID=2007208 RepID=A0A1Z1MLV1_9FLOR|nr:hypothetical protein [Dipterosiphonia australica]ARW66734.1 hypothetical protein [Dipterosiphonia australica]